tara:strand:- start:1027 stop:1485 length:459 start_codon:yes stop_codon:yes gene_type:complete
MRLLIVFIAVPLIEIGLFIQVGGKIGLWPTLLIVLITAIAGTWLVRSQGSQTLLNLQGSFQNMKDPTEPLAHGAMILFAGALLLTPGFFTDALGFLLLFAPFRRYVMQKIRSKLKASNIKFTTPHENPDESVIEGQFKQVSPNEDPSGWTKD